jgi:hypothetical protein
MITELVAAIALLNLLIIYTIQLGYCSLLSSNTKQPDDRQQEISSRSLMQLNNITHQRSIEHTKI